MCAIGAVTVTDIATSAAAASAASRATTVADVRRAAIQVVITTAESKMEEGRLVS